jgi:hypothetical protein
MLSDTFVHDALFRPCTLFIPANRLASDNDAQSVRSLKKAGEDGINIRPSKTFALMIP